MKKSRRVLTAGVIGALMLATAGVSVMSMPNTALADDSCHKINATGTGQDLGGGHTQADITDGGLLQGTTEAQFAATPTADPNVLTLQGTVMFTPSNPNGGTLTVGVTGTFNTATGDFTAAGPVTASTGKLAGATGNLTFTGNENFATGTFTETVNGTICANLAP